MEHVLVFASILMGVAVGDELISFHRLLRARARVKWDWLPLGVALLVLLTLVQVWWSIAHPAAGAITIAQFIPTLGELILLFLLAAAVLPDEVPAEGIDLRAFYAAESRYIWTLFALALGWIDLTGDIDRIAAGEPPLMVVANQSGDLIALALMVSPIFVRKRWWHGLILVLLMYGPIGWMSRSLS